MSTIRQSKQYDTDDLPPRWGALLGVTAALAAFGAGQGLSYPLFTILMQRQEMSPVLIGLSAAMMPIGLITSAVFIPRLVAWFGARRLAVSCAIAAALCFLLVGALQNWIAWFVVRFLLGVIINPLYVLGEIWALSLAPPKRRGRVMGVFNAIMGGGYAVGPFALALLGASGWAPFIFAIAAFLGCALVLLLVTSDLPGLGGEAGQDDTNAIAGVASFAPLAPALLFAVLVSAAVQQSTYALTPVFGAANGLGETAQANLVTALSLGNIFLQVPLGLAAERLGARVIMLGCALATAVCAVLVAALIGSPLIWLVLMVMGGVGYGVYTMALVELGNRFKGSMLVAGNSAFALMWGMGGIAGPPTAGLLMYAVGPLGLPGLIATFSLLTAAFVAYRSAARRRP